MQIFWNRQKEILNKSASSVLGTLEALVTTDAERAALANEPQKSRAIGLELSERLFATEADLSIMLEMAAHTLNTTYDFSQLAVGMHHTAKIVGKRETALETLLAQCIEGMAKEYGSDVEWLNKLMAGRSMEIVKGEQITLRFADDGGLEIKSRNTGEFAIPKSRIAGGAARITPSTFFMPISMGGIMVVRDFASQKKQKNAEGVMQIDGYGTALAAMAALRDDYFELARLLSEGELNSLRGGILPFIIFGIILAVGVALLIGGAVIAGLNGCPIDFSSTDAICVLAYVLIVLGIIGIAVGGIGLGATLPGGTGYGHMTVPTPPGTPGTLPGGGVPPATGGG